MAEEKVPVEPDEGKKENQEKQEPNGNVELRDDVVSRWLNEDEEGKKFMQSLTDKRVTQAINTYRENHFEDEVKTRVESEYRRLHPDETPEQKRLREVEKKMAEGERRAKVAELGKIAFQHANAVGVDGAGDLLDYFIGNNEEETRMRIDKFKDFVKLREEKKVNEILASNTKTPSGGDDLESINTMEDVKRHLDKHPDAMSDPGFVKAYERVTQGAK